MKNSTLSEFRRPADLPEPDPETVSMAQLYAWRDAEMFGDKTLQEWRAEIDALLAGGAPYGKIYCSAATAEAFQTWEENLRNLPENASPLQVYGVAPEAALSFLGY